MLSRITLRGYTACNHEYATEHQQAANRLIGMRGGPTTPTRLKSSIRAGLRRKCAHRSGLFHAASGNITSAAIKVRQKVRMSAGISRTARWPARKLPALTSAARKKAAKAIVFKSKGRACGSVPTFQYHALFFVQVVEPPG